MLNRDAILAAQDRKTVDVEVPEWGGTVRVQSMNGAERDAFGSSLVTPDGKQNLAHYREKLLVACVVGEDGKPLFTLNDLEALGAKSAVALKRVHDAADALNTIGPDEIAAAEKN